MAVLINLKICDNAKECGGINACPTGALSWDEKNKKILIDNSKCTSCMKCVGECPSNAIHVAKNDTEYKRIEKEIKEDPRKASDLFVDKYGAQPIDPDSLLEENEFRDFITNSNNKNLVEFFSKDTIECLLRSNNIRRLIPNKNIFFKKVEIKNTNLLKEYSISKLPSLLVFDKGVLLGKIEGFYGVDKAEELKNKITKLIEVKPKVRKS
jgi:NAD-dependent dihydropyrimidine dehydrogenase PreA subunit